MSCSLNERGGSTNQRRTQMGQRGYSLQFLFAAVTLFALVAWPVASPSEAKCLAVVLVWSAAGAVLDWLRGKGLGTVGWGAASGAASVVAFIACFWPVFVCGYFTYEGDEKYFEDGFVVETFLYPVVYCFVYAPLGALVGSIVGIGVWTFGHLIGRPSRSKGSVAPPGSFATQVD